MMKSISKRQKKFDSNVLVEQCIEKNWMWQK